MGEITISEAKNRLYAINTGAAGEIRPHPVFVLVFGQDFVYRYGDEFPGSVTEPESHRRNFSICIGTGNHLYRNVNAQNAFQANSPFLNERYIYVVNYIITCRTYVLVGN